MNSGGSEGARADDRPAEPMSLHRLDVPAESRHFFDMSPVLATHEGPWVYSRRPVLGAALKIAALVAGVVITAAIVVDQLRSDTLLAGDLVAAGGALGFLAVVMIGSPGIYFSRGRIRYRPTGRKLADHREDYRGDASTAAAVHAALTSSDVITRGEIQSIAGRPSESRLLVCFFWSDRDDVAVATVHVEHDDGEVTIWPPVDIPCTLVGGLLPTESSTFDVAAATQ
ncbi:hypothetical protein [Aeromicrobium sp. CTD01-1L150]|uniref:hypothetical protein n=1 Tax=Aeromicrobium sp. CTD01-1L150 TaxID=3341830 RepID=UPI0035BF5062